MALIKSSQVFRYFWCSGRIYILYNNLSFISQHFEKATTSKCKTRHVYKMVFSPLLLWLLCPFEKWEFIPLAHNSWGSGRRPDDQTRRFQNLALEVERTPLRQHWSCSKGEAAAAAVWEKGEGRMASVRRFGRNVYTFVYIFPWSHPTVAATTTTTYKWRASPRRPFPSPRGGGWWSQSSLLRKTRRMLEIMGLPLLLFSQGGKSELCSSS